MRSARLGGLLALVLGVAACGGADPVVNPLDSTDLSDAERAALASQVLSAASGVASSSQHPAQGSVPGGALAGVGFSLTPNGSVACPAAGHMNYSGNISGDANATTGAWSMYGAVTFQYGSPTNNLDDCQVSADLFVDGTLYFTIAGTNAGTSWTLTGTIDAARRGPTGGLVPRGSCRVFLNQAKGATKATGSVCGYAVN